jgi:hypothetical protein
LQFNNTINPEKISKALLTGLLIANCIFCRWGVKFLVADVATQTATIDLKSFKGDTVYAQSCIEELNQALPGCYSIKNINNSFLLIRFDGNI